VRLFLCSGPILLVVAAGALQGQEQQPSRRLEATVQASYIPLGRGAGVGPTFRIGFRPGTAGRHLMEIFYTITPANDYYAKPRLNTWGVLVGAGIGDPQQPLSGLLAFGVGRLHIGAMEFNNCRPPTCIAEGVGNYHDAQLTTIAADAGLLVGISSSLALRSDLRLHWPMNAPSDVGDSGDLRLEAAMGLSWTWGSGPTRPH
jgi:hypothetical protein